MLEHLFESPAGVRRLLKLHGASLVRVEIARGQGGRQHPLGEGWVDGQDRLVSFALAGWLTVGGRDECEDNIGGLAIEVESGHQLHHGVDGLAQQGHVLVLQDVGGVQRLESVVERDDHYECESSVLADVSVVQVDYSISGFAKRVRGVVILFSPLFSETKFHVNRAYSRLQLLAWRNRIWTRSWPPRPLEWSKGSECWSSVADLRLGSHLPSGRVMAVDAV